MYIGRDLWYFDTEDEFFAEYRKHEAYKASYSVTFDRENLRVLFYDSGMTEITVRGTGAAKSSKCSRSLRRLLPSASFQEKNEELNSGNR